MFIDFYVLKDSKSFGKFSKVFESFKFYAVGILSDVLLEVELIFSGSRNQFWDGAVGS